ncbi:Urea amidolyase [Exophiala dermatitidis]
MRNTVKLAKEHRVKIGAHPGLQDLIGFGRRKMEIHPDDMYSMILYQVGALEGILRAEGIPLNHIKPHGELFFYMQRDLKIMNAVLRACSVFKVPVYGAKGADEQKAMCESLGLIFVEEAYVDLQYDKNKRLLSFAQSKVATPKDVYARTLSIGMDDVVTNNEGHDILDICAKEKIDAVIPGYGFLSENAEFASLVNAAGMVFVGPSPASILEMGQKHRARQIAELTNVPIIPGTGLLRSEAETVQAARRLGFPVMLKATGGGGGMGLQICHSAQEVDLAFKNVRSRGEVLFKNTGVFLEKYFPRSHHVEVQVFGNGEQTIHFGERECSIQRRHQKVIEECPSPFVEARPGLREQLTSSATIYSSFLGYKSAGTVEFLIDDESGDFFFLEMNTRLQVEHGITELCYGVDLVKLTLLQADYEKGGSRGIPSAQLQSLMRPNPTGAAIEARIYAENPYRNFAPSPGVLQEVIWPQDPGFRVDTWIQPGQEVTLYYGPSTNINFVKSIMACDSFARGDTLTNFLDTQFKYQPNAIDVLSGGSYTLVQDFPARISHGHGIPNSGPMDNISSRIANLLVGNSEGVEVLELTLTGPTLFFTCSAVISICGATAPVFIDSAARPMWSRLVIHAGQTLKVGEVVGVGSKMYIAIRGGLPGVPKTFGSKSTTPSLKFGGVQGRQLLAGDFLDLSPESSRWAAETVEYTLPSSAIPSMEVSEIYVMQGPHDSDDIMTKDDRDMLYSALWTVGHNSSRTGVRLVGSAPRWARTDGGEGGSHPSNYLDPNLGGLVCSSTVISADLWKLGQLKPDDSIKLTPVTVDSAIDLAHRVAQYILDVKDLVANHSVESRDYSFTLTRCETGANSAILKTVPSTLAQRPKVMYRQGGDRFLLVEFGEETADLAKFTRVHALGQQLQSMCEFPLLLNLHIRTLTIEYDPRDISQSKLLSFVHEIESSLEPAMDLKIPCRQFRLPVVMDHPVLRECTQRYMETIRSKAVYLPDNLEYLRKSNGMDDVRELTKFLTSTEFVIVAVGFLCGAPILFPLTSKGLVAQKYNPTRTSTPGGTIGVGGAFLSGYPVEQPGGYMMLARTLEMWDTFGTKPGFSPARPWIFEPFDLVKFYEVTIEDYDKISASLDSGHYQWEMSEVVLDATKAYDSMQAERHDLVTKTFKERQLKCLDEQAAIEKQLYAEWKAAVAAEHQVDQALSYGDNRVDIISPMTASVWKVEVEPGDELQAGQLVVVLEAMKLEINVYAPDEATGAKVVAIAKKTGSIVRAGDVLVVATTP